jgi:hypothetical protein
MLSNKIRSECAAMATYVVEVHAIDLRSLFLALHRIEEFGIDRPVPKLVYQRSESDAVDRLVTYYSLAEMRRDRASCENESFHTCRTRKTCSME